MQLSQVKREIVTHGQMEVAKATIKPSAKIFDMFADQTYANKPVAICRELVANGIDAHIAAGKPQVPVEVTMPTDLEPEFKVKDTGIGMPHDFVMGPFMAYTDGSTKDQSNDQIGGFGIGSKSPFAYCDQFTLRVVHEGILSVYTMFKGEDGIPSIGLVAQTTTDEHNGVEVSFPVEADDMEDFRSAAQTALQYFQPLPVVHNGTLNAPDYTHVSSTGKWAMRASSGPLGVIMGGVRYPVNADSLPWAVRRNEKVFPLFDYGIDLTLPIGALDIAMSREALSYTQKTFDGLTQALSDIVDEVAATFATFFDKYPTLWDAQVALQKELSSLGGGSYYNSSSGRAGMMRSYAKYKGQPLKTVIALNVPHTWDRVTRNTTYDWPKGYPRGASAWVVQRYRRGFPTPKYKGFGTEISELTPGAYSVVFLDDMPMVGKSRTRARIQEYLEGNNIAKEKDALVLRAPKNDDAKSIAAMLKYLGSPTKIIRLSSLPEPARKQRVVTASDGSTYVRPKVRMFKYDGSNDKWGNPISNLAPGYGKRDAVTEIPYADQPTEGILVVLDGWGFPAGFKKKMLAGVVKWDELLFVLTGDAKKLKGGKFQAFDPIFDKRFKKEKRKHKNLKYWLAVADNKPLRPMFAAIENMRQWLNLTPAQKKTPFGQIVELYDTHVVPLTNQLRGFATNADILAEDPPGFDGEALVEAFKTQHPRAKMVLDLIDGSYRHHHGKDTTDLFVTNL